MEDPEEYIRSYEKNQTMSKMSLILSGKTEGVSNTGDRFTEDGLDFSAGGTVMGFPVSQSYLNYMGTWSYTIKCPVERDGREIGTLYAEYIYDAVDRSLPDGFYNKQASLYIMDAESQRFVLKPKGMGQRSAGHLNLADFYQANDIKAPEIRREVDACLESGKNILFYHDIRNVRALSYMWAVNGGTIFLVGYVPVQAIQREGQTVNQNIFIVVASMLAAFFLCILLYYLNWRQQDKLRREQEEERRVHSQQLAEALQAAQIASESKTTFLSNMSHDIRTPMNMRPGFEFLQTLIDCGYIDAEKALVSEAIEAEGPDFLAGKTPIVMAYWGAANSETSYGKTDFEMQVIGFPTDRGQMPVMPMTGLAVGAEAEHREDAAKVLDIMTSDEALRIYSETNRVISPSKNVKVDCVPALRPLNQRIEEGVYVLGSNASMRVEQWGNTCQIVRQLLGGATVDECMAAFDELQAETLS